MIPRPVSVAPDGGALYFVPVSQLRRGTGHIDFCFIDYFTPAQPHKAQTAGEAIVSHSLPGGPREPTHALTGYPVDNATDSVSNRNVIVPRHAEASNG